MMPRFLFASLIAVFPAFAFACSSKEDDLGPLSSADPDAAASTGTGGEGAGGMRRPGSGGAGSGGIGSGGRATGGSATGGRTSDAQVSDGQAAGGAAATDAGAPECKALVESTLPGVTIEFAASTKCVYTLAEAQAEIRVDYELVIAHDVPGFVTGPYQYPGDIAGLYVSETVRGNGQAYCVCDLGLPQPSCPETDGGLTGFTISYGHEFCEPITLKKGRYPQSFRWQGENWNGLSDTNNPKGPQFPTGDYHLIVESSPGWLGERADGMAATIQVKATLPIRLTP